MIRAELTNGGYQLTAGPGLDLVALDQSGAEAARAKTVDIPSGETLLEWTEAPERDPEPEPVQTEEQQLRQARIDELRRELEALEASASQE